MKRNIERLTVLVIIAAIAMFIVVAMASADDHNGRKTIHGQYAFTGGGTCLYAPFGFDSTFTPINGAQGAWLIQKFSREGVYTFEPDGTGSATASGRAITFPFTQPNPSPPPPTITVPPSAGLQELSWNFTYEVKHGTITLTEVPGTFVSKWTYGPFVTSPPTLYHTDGQSFEGTITPDGKIITLNGGVPNQLTLTPSFIPNLPTEIICNNSAVLIWQHDIHP